MPTCNTYLHPYVIEKKFDLYGSPKFENFQKRVPNRTCKKFMNPCTGLFNTRALVRDAIRPGAPVIYEILVP